jgi:hypothetical protein
MRSQEDQNRMIGLRRTGHSLPEISRITGICKSTVSRYVHDIPISPEYIQAWRDKQGASKKRAREDWETAWQEARSLLAPFDESQYLSVLACLYWAEGNKEHEFVFTNTDPAMMRTVTQCLRSLSVSTDRIIVSIRIFEDMVNRKEEIIQFWSEVCNVPQENIKQLTILEGKKRGKLKYGICRIRIIKGAKIFKLISSSVEYIKSIPMTMPS